MDGVRDPRQIVSNVLAATSYQQTLIIERHDFLSQREPTTSRCTPTLQDHRQQNQRSIFGRIVLSHALRSARLIRGFRATLMHAIHARVFGKHFAFDAYRPLTGGALPSKGVG